MLFIFLPKRTTKFLSMNDFMYLISEEGLPTFLVVTFLIGIGFVARWFATIYNDNLNRQFSETLREIGEIQTQVIESNIKVYDIVSKLIKNQKDIQQDINAIESSNDTLISFIKKNGNGHKFNMVLSIFNIKKLSYEVFL